ncbi:hypothetical protein MHI57_19135 [Cytobacillus sp. FSL K6-0129]|uniref:hypothetical protein n=1 Tax=Cytobacillus sp. FSL K6-0129 TaxID=2921421 RepID=UPI0030FA36D0
MIIFKMIRSFLYLLAIPVLFILYIGLIFSAVFSLAAGILRTFGFEQIPMTIWKDIDLPVILSIPFSLILSIILFIVCIYVKRSITYLKSHLN